jgi:hypothetical protein
MKTLISALAAVLVIGSASIALADDPAIDLAADSIRSYGPVASQQSLKTRPVALPRHKNETDSSSTDRGSQDFFGGF